MEALLMNKLCTKTDYVMWDCDSNQHAVKYGNFCLISFIFYFLKM